MSKESPEEEFHDPLDPLQFLDRVKGVLLTEEVLGDPELEQLKIDLALLKKFSTKENSEAETTKAPFNEKEAKAIKASLSKALGSIKDPTRLSTVMDIFKDGLDYNKALIAAVYEGNIEAINALLAKGAQIEARDNSGRTPLQVAVYEGNIEAINALLEKGAQTEVHNGTGGTLLHMASRYGDLEIINALLKGGANVNATDMAGDTPLHGAAVFLHGNIEVINALLKGGANVNATDITGDTPLHTAAVRGNVEVTNALLQAHATKTGRAPLPEGFHVNDGLRVVLNRLPGTAQRRFLATNEDIFNFYVDCRGWNGEGPLPGPWQERLDLIMAELNRQAGGGRAIGGQGVAREVHAEVFNKGRTIRFAQTLADNSAQRVVENEGNKSKFKPLDIKDPTAVDKVLSDFYEEMVLKRLSEKFKDKFPYKTYAELMEADKIKVKSDISAFEAAVNADKALTKRELEAPLKLADAASGLLLTCREMGNTTSTKFDPNGEQPTTLKQLFAITANEAMCAPEYADVVDVVRWNESTKKWAPHKSAERGGIVNGLTNVCVDNMRAYDKVRGGDLTSCAAGCIERTIDSSLGLCGHDIGVEIPMQNDLDQVVRGIVNSIVKHGIEANFSDDALAKKIEAALKKSLAKGGDIAKKFSKLNYDAVVEAYVEQYAEGVKELKITVLIDDAAQKIVNGLALEVKDYDKLTSEERKALVEERLHDTLDPKRDQGRKFIAMYADANTGQSSPNAKNDQALGSYKQFLEENILPRVGVYTNNASAMLKKASARGNTRSHSAPSRPTGTHVGKESKKRDSGIVPKGGR